MPLSARVKRREARSFLWEWLKAPLRTASITPSSKDLARKMARGIDQKTGPVIELGPGTGVFTDALLANGVTPENLSLIELNSTFAERLQKKYQGVQVIQASATDLRKINFGYDTPVGAVVSGLPILSMKDKVVSQIMSGAFSQLGPDGVFVQFTYGPACPVSDRVLQFHDLVAERVAFSLINIPPAKVFQIRRR